MRKVIIVIAMLGLLIFSCLTTFAGDKKVQFSTSLPDANIFANGEFLGRGEVKIVIPGWDCLTVKVERTGYLPGYIEFCNKPGYDKIPKDYQYTLINDESFYVSDEMPFVNKNIEVKSIKSEGASWKIIYQTVLSYFDDISSSDEKTGYIKTEWAIQNFLQSTVRTRVLIKLTSESPLIYNVKINSETVYKSIVVAGNEADMKQAIVLQKNEFTEWNRILRKYKNFLTDLQSKLNNK